MCCGHIPQVPKQGNSKKSAGFEDAVAAAWQCQRSFAGWVGPGLLKDGEHLMQTSTSYANIDILCKHWHLMQTSTSHLYKPAEPLPLGMHHASCMFKLGPQSTCKNRESWWASRKYGNTWHRVFVNTETLLLHWQGGYFTEIFGVEPAAADSHSHGEIFVAHGWKCVQTCEVSASQILLDIPQGIDINTDILAYTHKCELAFAAVIAAACNCHYKEKTDNNKTETKNKIKRRMYWSDCKIL